MDQIITSLLDTDLYKFNMGQVMFHKHSDLKGVYMFKCRTPNVYFTHEMFVEINDQIDKLCSLSFTEDELNYLRSIRFLKEDYIVFLKHWKPSREAVRIDWHNGNLNIFIRGNLFDVTYFEIYLLSIVNEVYYKLSCTDDEYSDALESGIENLEFKLRGFECSKYTFTFAEFGTRRRFSKEWQKIVLEKILLTQPNIIAGTSNVYFAKMFGLKPIGTYAHEYVQMYQGIPWLDISYGNKFAMEDWYDEYRGDNGIALSDTLTTDIFLSDFNIGMMKNFSGVRHDSGDPFEWGNKIISAYEANGIDPKTKTLLFSDSLDFDSAQKIHNAFNGRCNVAFGIGTFITNDMFPITTPLNIVIKLQYVNNMPVAKISDSNGKTMCQSDKYVERLTSRINERLTEHR